MRRYHITVGATTTVDGTVKTGYPHRDINGQLMAREGDDVYCPECDSTGTIVCDGPRLSEYMDDRRAALEGDLCHCKCDPSPRLIAVQTLVCQEIETPKVAPPPRTAAPPATPTAPHPPAAEARPANFTPTPSRPVSSYSELPGHACENLWRGYQQRVENVVAPGGKLITDPKARNKAINAAYAQLWRHDQRFQWAGLAAFASKQVGCGLLHAAESVDRIQAEHEAGQNLMKSANKRFRLFGLGEPERQARLQDYQQAQRDYQQARRDNPVPGLDLRRDAESLSLVQQQLQHVYEMLAMGNTTLFLDVFPLHVFYAERGLEALERCLPLRENIYGSDQHPMIWPIESETLKFGTDHEEIRRAFQAIDNGDIAKSVDHLARHEQVNILQPAMYENTEFKWLLCSNHFSYVTNLPAGAAQAVELTLASQCRPIDDGRTIGFSKSPFADLSDVNVRMHFVLKAATQFDQLLQSDRRPLIEQSIRDIATGGGVR